MSNQAPEIFDRPQILPNSMPEDETSTRTNSTAPQQLETTSEYPTGAIVEIPDSTMRPMPADRRCPRRGGSILRPVYTIPRPANFRLSLLELFTIRMLPGCLLIYLLTRVSRELIQSTYLVTKLTGRNPIPAILDLIGKFKFLRR